MHQPTEDANTGNPVSPLRSQRSEPRKHYFHFSSGYKNSIPGTLYVAGRRLEVMVPEQTQYGFTVLGGAQVAERLRLGGQWVLSVEEKRFEVFPQWVHCAADGRVQIGLRRMQQLASHSKLRFDRRFRLSWEQGARWTWLLVVAVAVGLVLARTVAALAAADLR